MIIVCEQCSRKYLLEDSVVRYRGVHLKCIGCNHQWYFIEPALKLKLEKERKRYLIQLNLYLCGFFNSVVGLVVVFAKNWVMYHVPSMVLFYSIFWPPSVVEVRHISGQSSNKHLNISLSLTNAELYLTRVPVVLVKDNFGNGFVHRPQNTGLLPQEETNILIDYDAEKDRHNKPLCKLFGPVVDGSTNREFKIYLI